METIATNTVLLVQLVRDSVHISLSWHCLMEGSIKYTYLRQTRHKLLNGVYTLKVCRVMQWSQIRALLESLQNLIGEDN